jgi:voltage-gated potassium channel
VWLAFWWAIQTVTTVGYGDVVPTQTSGKALASILMIGGLSFLSIITATVTSAFVARRQAELREAGKDPVMRQLDQIAARLDRIEGELRPSRDDPEGTARDERGST